MTTNNTNRVKLQHRVKMNIKDFAGKTFSFDLIEGWSETRRIENFECTAVTFDRRGAIIEGIKEDGEVLRLRYTMMKRVHNFTDKSLIKTSVEELHKPKPKKRQLFMENGSMFFKWV